MQYSDNPNEPESKIMSEIPKKENRFMGFIKNFIIFLLLVGIIVASFWVSFFLGKRILSPARQAPEPMVEMELPLPPPDLENLEAVIKEIEEKIEVTPSPAPEPAPVKTITTLPTKGTSYYKVVAGVFSTKESALTLAKNLNASGFETYIKKTDKGWRVQVGAFFNQSYAQNLQTSLRKKGFESSIIYE